MVLSLPFLPLFRPGVYKVKVSSRYPGKRVIRGEGEEDDPEVSEKWHNCPTFNRDNDVANMGGR